MNMDDLDSQENSLPEVQARRLVSTISWTNVKSTDIPNNQWLSYTSFETGMPEIYVRPWPDIESGKWQVSIGGGFAYWNKNANEIFF